jgi:ABC-2 type transport system permease protein
VRGQRLATVLWVLGGSLMMYVMAMALAQEMAEYPGGPDAFAASLRPGVEALRPMRWPADRLDTLGGYLTYHNLTLYTLLLSVYAAVQGSRAVRGAEERHSLEQVLATGWSRAAVVRDRALGFLLSLALVTVGVGLGVAA